MRYALCSLVFIAAPAWAQGAAPHALPFPGDAPTTHAIELALGGAAEAELTARVAAAPAWLRFEAPEAAAVLPEGATAAAEPAARWAFTVAPETPVGEAATVELVVTDAAGLERARSAFAVVVEAPALQAVRPNPSRGRAAVAFTKSGTEAVRVSVVDVLGREVAVLAEGALAAGRHEARVPSLASGTYVVRLISGTDVRAERFTVVR